MDNEEFGYVCGVLCGRGFIKRGRNNCVGIHTRNRSLAIHVASSLRNLCGYEPTIREKTPDGKTYFTVEVYGKDVVGIFDGIGFAPTRKIWAPPKIAGENAEFRLGFLAGFFDSTAVVYFNREKFLTSGSGYRYLRATSVNPGGLREVKNLLSLQGIESALRTTPKGLGRLVIRGAWRLKVFSERIPLRTPKKDALNEVFRFS
ncbi:MAG: LAGLIDADG family homing endonuclease [Candidatus Aenigmarchaeota archaeon]|nr:LAGLIDADG family homing endonuclease [Candidatus Aenigmarchaeota archaeon]